MNLSQRLVGLPPLIQGRHCVYDADVRELSVIHELLGAVKALKKELKELKKISNPLHPIL